MIAEGALNRMLTTALRQEMPGAVVFKISDRATVGIPDISLDWSNHHIWIETKRAAPSFSSPGIQELTMQRLNEQGNAWYVIYEEKEHDIYICSPIITKNKNWVKDKQWRLSCAYFCGEWDHMAVANFFKRLILQYEAAHTHD